MFVRRCVPAGQRLFSVTHLTEVTIIIHLKNSKLVQNIRKLNNPPNCFQHIFLNIMRTRLQRRGLYLRVRLEKSVQECYALVHFDLNNLLNGYS